MSASSNASKIERAKAIEEVKTTVKNVRMEVPSALLFLEHMILQRIPFAVDR